MCFLQESSPLLAKQGEDGSMSYDGEESRDTFTDAIPEILNTSMEEYTVVTTTDTKTPKRVRVLYDDKRLIITKFSCRFSVSCCFCSKI